MGESTKPKYFRNWSWRNHHYRGERARGHPEESHRSLSQERRSLQNCKRLDEEEVDTIVREGGSLLGLSSGQREYAKAMYPGFYYGWPIGAARQSGNGHAHPERHAVDRNTVGIESRSNGRPTLASIGPKLPENTRPPLTAHKAPPVKEEASDVPPGPLPPPPLKGDAARLFEIFKKDPVQLARSTAVRILEVKPGKELGKVNQGPSATDACENKPLSSEAEGPPLNRGFDPAGGMNPLHDAATTTSSHDSSGQHSAESHKKRQKLRKYEWVSRKRQKTSAGKQNTEATEGPISPAARVVDPEVLLRNLVRQQPSVVAGRIALSVGDPDPDTYTSLEDTATPNGNVETSKEPRLSSIIVPDTGTLPEDTANPNDTVKARKKHKASGVGDRIPNSATHNSPEDTATPNNKAETPNEATAPDSSNPVANTPLEDQNP
ncbi:MAG: hypothetical protein Q9221_000685 [Calogaya cf. arnoldii]